MGHLCCLKLIENKVGAFGDFFLAATRRTGALKAQNLESGVQCWRVCEREWHWR